LFDRLKKLKINNLHTDKWHSYDNISEEYNPTKTKDKTTNVESANSDLRHFVPRLIRKTKNYTKSKYVLNNVLQVFCYFFNKKLFKKLFIKKEFRIFAEKAKVESIKNGFGYGLN